MRPDSNSLTLRILYRIYRWYASVRIWVRHRFTTAGKVALGSLPVTAAMGLDTNQSATYQIFTGSLAVLTVALLVTRRLRPTIRVSRELPKYATVGERFDYWLNLENPGSRPQRSLWLCEEPQDPRPDFDTFANEPEPLEASRNAIDRFFRFYRWLWHVRRSLRCELPPVHVDVIPPKGQSREMTSILPLRRGTMRLTGTLLAEVGPLGLCRYPVRISQPAQTIVLPRRYRLPRTLLPGAARYQPGGVSQASRVGESEEFSSLRDYRRGDPMTRIHWKSWAKAGKPIVKEYQQEYFVRHALVLDTYAGAVSEAVFEGAVSLAASFAATVDDRESLLDLLFVGDRAHCFTAGRGVSHAEQILEVLAGVQPQTAGNFETLERLVQGHVGSVAGCICVLVAWDEPRLAFLRRLKQQGVPLLIFGMLDAGETAPQPEDLPLTARDRLVWLHVDQMEAELARIQ